MPFHGALTPYDDVDRRGRRRRGELALFDPFMSDPFSRIESFMNEMTDMAIRGPQLFGDPDWLSHTPGGLGMHSMSQFSFGMDHQSGEAGRPMGVYHSETRVVNATVGPDGNPRVEKYASTAVGNSAKQMHEVKEAYSNSETGIDRMALEREMRGKGRRVVKERNRVTGHERMDDELRGMEDAETHMFDQEWQQQSSSLPPTRGLPMLGQTPMLGRSLADRRSNRHHQITSSSSETPAIQYTRQEPQIPSSSQAREHAHHAAQVRGGTSHLYGSQRSWRSRMGL